MNILRTINALLLYFAIIITCTNVVYANDSINREYYMENVGVITLVTPNSWIEKIHTSKNQAFPIVVSYDHEGKNKYTVGLSFSRPFSNIDLISKKSLKEKVDASAKRQANRAVENELVVKEISSNKLYGYYFVATDKSPDPGDYKYMSYGYVRIYNHLIWFTVLSNDVNQVAYTKAVNIIETIRINNEKTT